MYRHVYVGPLGVRALFSICFVPLGFLDGVFSEAYERAVMRTVLVTEVIDRAGPLSLYLATMFCRTDQNKVAEGYYWGSSLAHEINGPHAAARGSNCKL